MENGQPGFRADIGMRIVIDVASYAKLGSLMDTIQGLIEDRLKSGHERAAFDFTHFNTQPCKADLMAQRAMVGVGMIEYDQPDAPVALPRH
jgi:hypothetical protein